MWSPPFSIVFFFNDTATTEIYTLSLHDALPISLPGATSNHCYFCWYALTRGLARSEEHTSELQSHLNLVCRLLLEKKKLKKLQWLYLFIQSLKTEAQSQFLQCYSL